jgi:hypothetical protein
MPRQFAHAPISSCLPNYWRSPTSTLELRVLRIPLKTEVLFKNFANTLSAPRLDWAAVSIASSQLRFQHNVQFLNLWSVLEQGHFRVLEHFGPGDLSGSFHLFCSSVQWSSSLTLFLRMHVFLLAHFGAKSIGLSRSHSDPISMPSAFLH